MRQENKKTTSTNKITNFEKAYTAVQKLENEYKSCKDENARKKAHQEICEIIQSLISEDDVQRFIWYAYKESRDNGNKYINFSNLTRKHKVNDYVRCMKKQGFTHFTMTSTWSNVVEVAWRFEEAGCELCGMTHVTVCTGCSLTRKYQNKPAFIFEL